MNTVTWTDNKIDVLDGKVDTLDSKVDALGSRVGLLDTKVDALDTRVGVLEKKVDVGFARTDERFIAINQQLADLRVGQAQMNDRFADLQHILLQVGFSLVVGLLGGMVALIVAVIATN